MLPLFFYILKGEVTIMEQQDSFTKTKSYMYYKLPNKALEDLEPLELSTYLLLLDKCSYDTSVDYTIKSLNQQLGISHRINISDVISSLKQKNYMMEQNGKEYMLTEDVEKGYNLIYFRTIGDLLQIEDCKGYYLVSIYCNLLKGCNTYKNKFDVSIATLQTITKISRNTIYKYLPLLDNYFKFKLINGDKDTFKKHYMVSSIYDYKNFKSNKEGE